MIIVHRSKCPIGAPMEPEDMKNHYNVTSDFGVFVLFIFILTFFAMIVGAIYTAFGLWGVALAVVTTLEIQINGESFAIVKDPAIRRVATSVIVLGSFAVIIVRDVINHIP